MKGSCFFGVHPMLFCVFVDAFRNLNITYFILRKYPRNKALSFLSFLSFPFHFPEIALRILLFSGFPISTKIGGKLATHNKYKIWKMVNKRAEQGFIVYSSLRLIDCFSSSGCFCGGSLDLRCDFSGK